MLEQPHCFLKYQFPLQVAMLILSVTQHGIVSLTGFMLQQLMGFRFLKNNVISMSL